MATDKGFYYVILFFAVLSALTMVGIMKSRLGRILGAMSDSPLALETLGTTVNVSRVLIFCISSFMAAIAGALSASLFFFRRGLGVRVLLLADPGSSGRHHSGRRPMVRGHGRRWP